jgi:hypothetical protein
VGQPTAGASLLHSFLQWHDCYYYVMALHGNDDGDGDDALHAMTA